MCARVCVYCVWVCGCVGACVCEDVHTYLGCDLLTSHVVSNQELHVNECVCLCEATLTHLGSDLLTSHVVSSQKLCGCVLMCA